MSILFSGDFHANDSNELSYITKHNLVKKYNYERFKDIRYHIILGDCAFLRPDNYKTDRFNYKALSFRPFPILCVLGNDEPIYGMNNIPEVDIGLGESVYQIQAVPFVAYLKRGKVYTIDGIKFLVLGGALSVDKSCRTPGKTWWEKEYWSQDEKNNLFKLIESENTFDFVLSHTGPDHINMKLFGCRLSSSSCKMDDEVAFMNDEVHENIQFIEWWCGHFHQNLYYYDSKTNRGYQYLYKLTKILEKIDNKMVIYNEYGMMGR